MLNWMKKILKTRNVTPEQEKREALARIRFLQDRVVIMQRKAKYK